MSREVDRLYRALARDTDERVLPAPDHVRRRADRRARRRAALGALTVAVLVAGTAAGTRLVLAAGPDTAPAPATTTDGPSPSPTTPAPPPSRTPPAPSGRTPEAPAKTSARPPDAGPRTIPDRAFFTLAAANDAGTGSTFDSGRVLPPLCGATPGESGIVTRRARSLAFKLAATPEGYVPDGSYRHTITVYRPGRADDALAELRRAVRDCPTRTGSDAGEELTSTQRLLPDAGYGDESVLFEVRRPATDYEGAPTVKEVVRLVRAVRIGNVVTVLWELGWEGTSTPRSQLDSDSRRAVQAVRDWLR
ncbi:hypothetical protein GCE86_20990 [Micromonospora terminaliae]|uniref:Uncharacterized protein n=1 Tax=Micromonospora terminaliae TaxID=1914461 RepID=A0AAJ2ZG89_9ACTN|nr:hypothetical protein [Micromonospora terminaliae]NES28689.1 hypothetical protein [Micromonospora terminaliae]QGL49273.1 hypothetical protein GCE86_20990 [Micromonospora terminaliae]